MRQPKGSNQFSGFLDQGTILKGELSFSGAVRIDGIIHGSITTPDLLIVGAGAEVEADVSVGEIEIYGDLTGDIDSSVRVTVHAGGHLKGNVSTPRLVIEDGAEFDGVSETVSTASEARAETKVATPKTLESPDTVDSVKASGSGGAADSRKDEESRAEAPVPVKVVLEAGGEEDPSGDLENRPKARWQNISRSMTKRWSTVKTSMARRD